MCGLTGFLNRRRDQTVAQMMAITGDMARTLHHRGPDDAGIWSDASSGISLAFKRLSILDLSPCGHQPMASHCGRFVLVFNGEIYNHGQLRSELVAAGHAFRGRSDTEVMVEGFSEWGIEATIRRCTGMFAIAVWDCTLRSLTLVRDRLGKKPLYYGQFDSVFLFGSELKSLRAHPAFVGEVDRTSLSNMLHWSYISPPATIYRNVSMLKPGTMITVREEETSVSEPCPYWSFSAVAEAACAPQSLSYDDATSHLDALLTDAVGCRMIADVPLGALLSGGIDSSLIVALMQKQSNRPVKTFTIGFDEPAYNEAPYARQVASHLKTDHTELYVTAAQARDVIPRLPAIFDEPFADSSQIPTWLVCQLASQHVKVALSGDGGDEVFCGYRRYFEAFDGFDEGIETSGIRDRVIWLLRHLPSVLAHPVRAMIRAASGLPFGRLARRFGQLNDTLNDSTPVDRYLRNLSHWRADSQVVLGAISPPDSLNLGDAPQFKNLQQTFQWYDTQSYLPGDILTKVDRTSMSVSLEARAPLLDHRVVEFAWSLPHEFKVQQRQGKRILRDVLARYVPRNLFDRPKVGFGVPIASWLRGPLRDWAEDLLDECRLVNEGYLNPIPIRRKWVEHLKGKAEWHYLLWDVLMFQAWLAAQSNR